MNAVKTGELCDKTNEPALYRYTWDWGTTGFCSGKGKFLIEQEARNIRRPNAVQFETLQTGPAPIELEERARYEGRIFALEHELTLKAERNVAQYTTIEDLRRDLKISEAQRLSLIPQLDDAKKAVGTLQNELVDAKRELTTWKEETLHLRGIVQDSGDLAKLNASLKTELTAQSDEVLRLSAELSALKNAGKKSNT